MRLKILLITIIFNIQYSIFNPCVAQDTSRLQISLLTCTPGEELYSTFGHTAIRIVDSNSLTDIVYNYGTFNFDDDNFLLKFVRGKLPYYISTENFTDFKELYQFTNRGITEQILNLSTTEKLSIRSFLTNNLKGDNKYYKYDFTFDNCTTRIKDILKKQHDSSFTQTTTMPIGTTFRNAIHVYLNNNQQYWSKLGIDILLGSPMDAKMTIEQQQFLPDNLMHSLDSSKNLILSSQSLYPINNNKLGKPLFTPIVIFTLLLLAIIALSFSKNKIIQASLKGFYGLYFFVLGLLGIVLLFMWFATDHGMCKGNYNLLWAIPTHLFVSFVINSKKAWVKKYLRLNLVIQILVLLSWFFLPQQMNIALLPLVLLSIFISYKKGFATDYTN
jgi:Domain of unknown function (DUF4105)